ncbi:type ISP restriction/modification enzyme [Bartonella sp. AA23NXGY]|uniref:type ISP restriction/modification enzyme n=1 Tax=Bartonella sp. AA23NXGY TaxID=3243431 RepID=UPI0035D13182
MIAFYNSAVKRFNDTYSYADRTTRACAIDNFVTLDIKKISWSYNVTQELIRGKVFEFEEACLTQSSYHPFTQQWFYYNRNLNDGIYQMPRIVLIGQKVENRMIQITGIGARSVFSVLIAKNLPNLDAIDTGQYFPRYLYKNVESL